MADMLETRDGAVVTITMNRPDRLNAITNEMLDSLIEMVQRLDEDESVGCVVLTGTGRAFCAGGDVKTMAEGSEATEGFDGRARSLRRRRETMLPAIVGRWVDDVLFGLC